MFVPKFNKGDPDITFVLQDIDRIKFRIERLLIMKKHEQWLQREAFLRTAYSSTMVENPTISERELENAAKIAPTITIPKDRPDVVNYGRALEFVDFVSDTEIAPDESVIRQIHWNLMKGVNDTRLMPGQYRTEPNWIEDQGMKVYEPPFHVDIPILMREFSLWLREGEGLNPILKAGIAHLHLVAIHPFVDGNGRTARLLATLLLQKYGYGFRKLLSLDSFYQRSRNQYVQALGGSIGKRFDADYDATLWLKFFTMSIMVQASLLEGKLTDWRMMVEDIHAKLIPTGLSERQIDGLIYAVQIGYITRKDYIEITGVSPLTATRDLKNLVKHNSLVAEGIGRSRKYISIIKKEVKSEPEKQKTLS